MSAEIPTPRTNAVAVRPNYSDEWDWCRADFARALERELHEAKGREQALREALKGMCEAFDSETDRRYFTAASPNGWTMLEIGACDAARQALSTTTPP